MPRLSLIHIYHYTEAGFQKRFWFSAFGYTDVILKVKFTVNAPAEPNLSLIHICPVFSIMNPELTYTLPAYQTACGIADMMAHRCV